MNVALMQPYFFPYIGYFQLIQSVDVFVFYDDVNYIKQGWINKNRILVNSSIFEFSVPLEGISSFRKICNTPIHSHLFSTWKEKFLRSLDQSYKKSPFFSDTYHLVGEVLNEPSESIGELARCSVQKVCKYLDIKTQLVPSSAQFHNSDLSSSQRVMDTCKQLHAGTYVNLISGEALYDSSEFETHGLKLKFLKPKFTPYPQKKGAEFVSGLSIIDILMNQSPDQVSSMLHKYDLV